MRIEFDKIDLVETFVLPNNFVDDFMLSMNGEYVKIYLYFLRNRIKEFDVSSLADEFHILESDILRALKYLSSKGLIKVFDEDIDVFATKERPIRVKEEKEVVPDNIGFQSSDKSVTAQEENILRDKNNINLIKLDSDKNFKILVQMVSTYLRSNLSQTDIRILAYMYDVLKLPIDVIEYLVEVSIENDKRSLRYMEKIAISWHEQGISTKEEAIKQKLELKNKYRPVLNAIGLYDVQYPTDNQKEFIDKWYDKYAFPLEIICKAAQTSIDRKGKVGLFEYTDKILSDWKANNVRSLNDIEKLAIQFKESKKNNSVTQAQGKVFTANKFNSFPQRNDDLELKVKNRL